ncbi:MAG: glycosyltransferase family 2 protein [Patescibacteria group bacterium]
MKIKKPIVSIILPVYNCERFLQASLESLSKQTFRKLEIIAIDDFSKDSSYKILKKFKKRNKRLRVYRNVKRYGAAITLNRAIRKAKGQFIAFSDSKDIAKRQRIKKQIDYLLKNPRVVAVGTQCYFINKRDQRIGKSFFPKVSLDVYQALVPGLSMEFKTAMINCQLLPKDILRFENNASPFLFANIFIKFKPYGEITNLAEYLCYSRKSAREFVGFGINYTLSLLRIWLKSVTVYTKHSALQNEFRLTEFLQTIVRMLRFSIKVTSAR